MRIVFHGENAASFREGFEDAVGRANGTAIEVATLPDVLASEVDRSAYAAAAVIVGVRYDDQLPRPDGLKLFHVPGAGTDGVRFDALPRATAVCNCFGHEQAIAEYVMAALLLRRIPLPAADRDLREGRWTYRAGDPARAHGELAGSTIGLLGFGHIGRAIAVRAKAFEMNVIVANRTPVPQSRLVEGCFTLSELPAFFGLADAYVVSLPLLPETTGIVGRAAFAAMRPHAIVVNVGRGPTIDERALYEALKQERIGGAIIDPYLERLPGNARDSLVYAVRVMRRIVADAATADR